MPRTSTSSLAVSVARCRNELKKKYIRVGIAFWFCGLINGVLFHIILAAALDIIGPGLPKGMVLLVNEVPCLAAKLLAVPTNLHQVPYWIRILGFVALSTSGMLLIGLTASENNHNALVAKMAGIALASISGGAGELSYLGLTHYYSHLSLGAYASGSGASGLLGSGAYVVATIWFGWSVKSSLLLFSFLPIITLISFFIVLPKGFSQTAKSKPRIGYARVPQEAISTQEQSIEEQQEGDPLITTARSSSTDHSPPTSAAAYDTKMSHVRRIGSLLRHNLECCRNLFVPYMLPLFLVYVAEYTINQGVTPTLLYPLAVSPFKHFREFYPTYIAIYQIGTFMSRSSMSILRIHSLYIPSLFQCANFVLLFVHATLNFIPSVYIIFAIVLLEGLLGGLVYVSTFAEIRDNVTAEAREFSLGATSASNSAGVCIAGVISIAIEIFLCDYQLRHGRDFCTKA